MNRLPRPFKLAIILAATSCDGIAEPRTAPTGSTVPFVGCQSDGQMGPVGAPRSGRPPTLSPAHARQLAYYAAADGPGVLAPRGWHCFGLYGSNGATLIVTPTAQDRADYSREGHGTAGPAVELIYRYGGTSGRWSVAAAIARFFPQRRSFIRDNFEGLDVGPLPSGPYETDILQDRTDNVVRFVTPARSEGMGTEGLLDRGPQAVQGLVMLLDDPDGPNLLTVNARLPPGTRDLTEVILRQAAIPAD